MTVKGLHHGGVEGWAMIAGLQVLKVFKSHEAAAEFYTRRQKRLKLPTNCVIPSNPPLPAKYTTGLPDRGIRWRNQWTKSVEKTFSPTVKNWDKQYQERAKNHPAFVVTRPIVPCQLRTPKILTRANLEEVFGRLPITQAPNKISDEEFSALLAHL
ncbi:MAG: hypothetical protein Q7K57_47165 [Burkholderiaceae bacterium]|nr:hypothetical protein [Burkholderiaceae bacterium]